MNGFMVSNALLTDTVHSSHWFQSGLFSNGSSWVLAHELIK